MKPIPTAEEFYKSIVGDTPNNLEQHNCTVSVIIEFAKLHVQAHQEAIELKLQRIKGDLNDIYPLTNIK